MARRHLVVTAAGLGMLLAAGCASAPDEHAGGSGATQFSSVLSASGSALASASASESSNAAPAPVVIDPQPGRPARVVLDTQVAARGDVVVACPPRSMPLAQSIIESRPEKCDGGVPVDGLDVDRMTDTEQLRGALTGRASITADYDGNRLSVIIQRTYDPRSDEDPTSETLDAPVSCRSPAGGWPQGEMNHEQTDAVHRWIESHPDEYGDLSIAYPVELPKDEQQSGPMDPHFVVLVVGATGDTAAANTELSTMYSGNLCVVRSSHSYRDTYGAWERLRALDILGPDTGVSSSGIAQITRGDPVLTMTIDRWTPRLDDIWRRIDSPDLILDAWMRPAD